MAVPVMSSGERKHLRTLVSRQRERAEIREALAFSAAKSSIDRMLGEELIAAAQEVRELLVWLASKHSQLRNAEARISAAIAKIDELVPR